MKNALAREEILATLKKRRDEMRRLFSVRRVGIFGSAARGEATADSDLDIIADLEITSFDHYMDLKFYLEDLFGRSVDVVLPDTIKPRLKTAILRDVVYV